MSDGESPDPQEGPVGAELQERIDRIRLALARAGTHIPSDVADGARADLNQVARRLRLGVDHAVAALVGGTGSGKSSMFNALSRLDFADVGVIRPTTSQATACVWGPPADRLLDFLGVESHRRIQHESELTGPEDDPLKNLVLLDLPDHDSVQEGHASLVDRLLPMIDLLMWVVDPQKYADNLLHEKYLRELTDRRSSMLVIVNQVDTVPETGLDRIQADVRRLLASDDLEDVPIVLASARTGHGVGMVRDHLVQVMAGESVAARTARDEVAAVSRRVGTALATEQPEVLATERIAEDLAQASGVGAVADSIRTAVSGAGSAALAPVQPPAASRIEAIRERWLEQVAGGMPAPWRTSVVRSVAAAGGFHDHVTEALRSVPLPAPVDRGARVMRVIGWIAVLAAVGLGIAALVLRDATSALIAFGGAAVALLVAGLICVGVARRRRRATGAARSEAYQQEVAAALRTVVTSDLEEPAEPILADHQQVYEAVHPS